MGAYMRYNTPMMSTEEEPEILDLVDEHDSVIGEIDRSETYRLAEGIGYVRASEAFIINDKNQLWIPVRTLAKKISPGGFDFSAAEHIGKGESYTAAMVRGFQEELNLTVKPDDLEFPGIIPPDETSGIYYFRAIFLYRSNQAPQYNRSDYMSAEWMTLAGLRESINAGAAAKTVILPTLDYLVAKKVL